MSLSPVDDDMTYDDEEEEGVYRNDAIDCLCGWLLCVQMLFDYCYGLI